MIYPQVLKHRCNFSERETYGVCLLQALQFNEALSHLLWAQLSSHCPDNHSL